MKLHFLGGANEVGASCTLIEMEGHRVLVDAGIRMGARSGEHLPNLSILDEVGPPEEVLVTHAHTDHTGALPVVAGARPGGAAIRCTAATKAITRVLLSDAVKIMGLREQAEGELPLYPAEAADGALARMRDVSWLTTVPICSGGLSATWIPSGHILGAGSIFIEGQKESVLMTGDVSVANQRTIPGMVIPHCRPDVVVMESTYGNRQHADRVQQEASLATRVAAVVEDGGKVLIPAFAVGRAQEVILILSRAMRRGEIPSFPVFVDGMVRSVNAVYAAFQDDLSPAIRRQVARGDDPFYGEWVGAVSSSGDREKILAGPPCCVVASSGMLIGGASSYYAERMVEDPDNLIAITGYQDEESPGRALLDLASTDGDRELVLNGTRTPVACKVETYSLSAHADAGELTALARRLGPASVYLVHGDSEARNALASQIDAAVRDGVVLPDNGLAYEVETREGRSRGYGRRVPRQGIAGGRPLALENVVEIRAYLEETGGREPFRVQELAEVWFGSSLNEEDVHAVGSVLKEGQHAFVPDSRRPFLFRFAQQPSPSSDGRMEMNQARERIVSSFPDQAGLIRCSAHVDQGVYELAVHFPDSFLETYAEALARVEEETGWQIRVRSTPHQGRLFEEAYRVLPVGVTARKAPALRLDSKEVVVAVDLTVDARAAFPDSANTASEAFERTTGFRLSLVDPVSTQGGRPAKAPSGAMEINRAYGVIRERFGGLPHQPYRVGLKSGDGSPYIEAAFISREVGERYRDLLDEVQGEIGYEIRVRPSANQEQIGAEARRATPDGWGVRGVPQIHTGESRVVVQVIHEPPASERASLSASFESTTGFAISWEVTDQ